MIDYGILIRKDGKFKPLTGNQIGVIMLEYILSQMKEKNMLKDNYYISADTYGIKCYETLTGFKNLCSASKDPKEEFLFGFEESFGYLYGDHARDKDRCCSINVNA